MKLPIVDIKGNKAGTMTVSDEVFGQPMNAPLVSQTIHVYLTNQRQAPAKVLTRGETYGSRKKLWKQKGTGRARHGDRFAPQFVGGGVAHGPTGDQNFKRRISEAMKRKALFCALSAKQQEGKLTIVDKLSGVKKTKSMGRIIDALGDGRRVLCVIREADRELSRVSRNLEYVNVIPAQNLNAYLALVSDRIVMTQDTAKYLESSVLPKEAA